MFDDNFNPIIIHFGNAIISDNHQNDFFGLGLILVGLISSKKIISYKFNKKQNNYIFRFYSTNNYFHESSCEESVFWKILESNKNVIISKEFIDFFHLLVIPDKVLNIDELFNNIWLKDIKIYHKEIEQNFREEFKNNYFFLSQSQKLVNNFNNNSNLNNIINADEMHESISSKSLIDKFIWIKKSLRNKKKKYQLFLKAIIYRKYTFWKREKIIEHITWWNINFDNVKTEFLYVSKGILFYYILIFVDKNIFGLLKNDVFYKF